MTNRKNSIKGDKRIMKAWVFYDWANSVYPLVITTAIFPLFYALKVNEEVTLFNFTFSRIEIYSYTLALSHIIVAILSPILSGMADYTGSKKLFMRIFNYIGAASCMALSGFDHYPLLFSYFLVFMANIGFWGSLVFYNAYLPEIAEPKDHDRLSARGFSLGYIGGALLLIVFLALIMMASDGEKAITMMRYSFIITGVWWVGFAQITYARLPNNIYNKKPEGRILSNGFRELKTVWKEFRKIKRLKRFLRSFFLYSMAVQTILTMSQFFGTEAILWDTPEQMQTGMIVSILIIQFIAVPGAMLFARMSSLHGNINVLIVAIVIWILICASAYFITLPIQFYALAGVVGFVMGGIQSLSRSTYSKFLPDTQDHTSYFSFYDVLEKIGVAIGIISFGFIEGRYNIRYSIMALAAFFVIGLILLTLVPRGVDKNLKIE